MSLALAGKTYALGLLFAKASPWWKLKTEVTRTTTHYHTTKASTRRHQPTVHAGSYIQNIKYIINCVIYMQ